MTDQPTQPTKLADFKGHPPRVSVTKDAKDESDKMATKSLIELYTQDDGWHCPRCGEVFTDGDLAVSHLAEEINNALDKLGR